MSAELLIRLPDYFVSLIDAMQDGFILRGVDGTILEANVAFMRMTGLERSEIIGSRPPHIWWPEEERDTFDRTFRRYLAGKAGEDDLIFKRKNGERFPAVVTSSPLHDSDGRVIAYIGTVKDMSERVKVEHQLHFQAALLDHVQAAVVATDATGVVTFWSRGADELYGWTRSEALGVNLHELLVGPQSRGLYEEVDERMRSGSRWEGEFPAQRRDGSTVPVLLTSAPIVDGDGELVGIVGVSVDISERKRAERRLATQHDVTHALANADTLNDGLVSALRIVGGGLGWQFGSFWSYDDIGGTLRCSEFWSSERVDHASVAEWQSATNALALRPGEGLPGRAWDRRETVWLADIDSDGAMPRKALAESIGIRSGVAFPVQSGQQPLGVIELFSVDSHPLDADLHAMKLTIGSQIGQFIERKRAERALRESEDRFRSMADSAPVLLWVAGPDTLCTWFNAVWLNFTGRTLDQELGHGWTEVVHPDDLERALTVFRESFDARQPFQIDYRVRRHDGEYRWVLGNGTPRLNPDGSFAGFIGSAVDITDRRRAADDQRFMSEATRVLASSLDYRTTLTGVAQMAVPHVADWCAVHVVEPEGGVMQLAVAHSDPAKVEWARELNVRYPPKTDAPYGLPQVIRSGQPELYPEITEQQLIAAAQDEEHLTLIRELGFTSAMIVPIVARERVLGAMTFVSAEQGRHYGQNDLRVAEQLAERAGVAIDNARLYREAQEAARARDQFLAVAAHELRSPLTSMKGFAQLMLRRAERAAAEEEWLRPLRAIDTQANRVADLVNRLLDVSRIEEKRLLLQLEPSDMRDILDASVAELELAAESHELVVRIDDVDVTGMFDRSRVQQVLSNLIDNAIKYSALRTTITVSVGRDGDDVVVSVADQGVGVSEETRENVFERYFRGKASARPLTDGLGLGLYVAHGIVEAHGGRMWFESEVNRGSTFSFSLPRRPPVDEPPAGAA